MSTKIFLHIPDDHACTFYRATMPMLHLYGELNRHGIQLTGDIKSLPYEEFDVYIFNRLVRPLVYKDVVEPLLKEGKKFVWQCDDNLWAIPSWNPAAKLVDSTDLATTTTYIDDCVSLWLSTDALSDFIGRPEKTRVLPNIIDLNHYYSEIQHDEKPIKIVWSGSASHDGDFDVIIEPVVNLLEKYKDKIAIIFWGYLPTGLCKFERQPGFPHANLIPKYQNLFYGNWFSIREYYYKLKNLKPDIAIMPLEDCVFNYMKSNLKFLEMSMAGAACVATDLPPYNCIRDKENGILVKPNDVQGWYDAIDELIENKEYRLKLNAAAREQIIEKYTWRSPTRELWLQAFLDLAS